MWAARARTRLGFCWAGLTFSLVFLAGRAVAASAETEPVRARLSASLLDEVIHGFLPATLALPRNLADLGDDGARTVILAELRYCGASEKGAGRFRAVLRPAAIKTQSILTASDGCQASLPDLAMRGAMASNGSAGFVLADLETTWKAWELKLAIAHAVIVGKGGPKAGTTAFDKRAELLSVTTSDLRIDTGAGAPMVLHAAPSFAATAIDLAVAMTDGPPPKAAALEKAAATARGDLVLGQGNANLAAEIPLSLANQILRRLTWTQPLTIALDRDDVEIRQVALTGTGAGKSARLSATGSATPRSLRETMQWTVALGGEPLVVSSAQFAGQLEDCSGLATMAAVTCNLRNGARGAAAEGFGSALTQRYQGQSVHELASPLDLHFQVAGQRIELRGELLQFAFGPRGLAAAGHMASAVRD